MEVFQLVLALLLGGATGSSRWVSRCASRSRADLNVDGLQRQI